MIYFKPDSDENTTCIRSFDGETVIGSCTIDVNGYECTLSELTVSLNDSLLVEGLIRSALNYAANRGAYIANCSQSEFDTVLKLLGFVINDGVYSGEIPELLKGSCCKN